MAESAVTAWHREEPDEIGEEIRKEYERRHDAAELALIEDTEVGSPALTQPHAETLQKIGDAVNRCPLVGPRRPRLRRAKTGGSQ